jgi:hypothetical protein
MVGQTRWSLWTSMAHIRSNIVVVDLAGTLRELLNNCKDSSHCARNRSEL